MSGKGDMVHSEPAILYEDEHVLVVNKPAGLAVHRATPKRSEGRPDGRREEYTVSDWALEYFPSIQGVGEPLTLSTGEEIERHGIVHRLDRDTSGVLVLAKTQTAFEYFKKQFQERSVEKAYRAVVYGEVKNDTGAIDRPIGRSATDFRKWSAQRGARGKMREALTEYKVIKRGEGHTLLDVYPKTGRTHQIRVHLKAVNHPVMCDALYAPKRECALGMRRLALHASSISFVNTDGERITVQAPEPADFAGAVAEL